MQPGDVELDDEVDAALLHSMRNRKRVPSIEALNSEMPIREYQKDKSKKIIRAFLNKLRLKKCASATISRPDPTYRVAYLGNVVTGWAKGDGCVEKPLATLWRNYTHSSRPDVKMTLAVSNGGLKATTKDHGLTEYWAHRLTFCAAPNQFPRLFCWVYRHEGRRLRHELRCHAVLCSTPSIASKLESELNQALAVALAEFRKDKISRQNARLSLVNCVYENPTIPRRKILLSTGSHSYRPPLERSKSAPKLTIIEESVLEEDDEFKPKTNYKKILRHYDSTSYLFDKRKHVLRDIKSKYKPLAIVPVIETCDEEINVEIQSKTPHKPDLTENLNDVIQNEQDKTDFILDSLLKSQMKNDLLESCERAWFNALGDKPDLIPLDSDEGSLSSGCESASTVNSEMDQPFFPTIEETSIPEETEDEGGCKIEKRKTELDFKVGGSVLARVRNFESGSTESIKCRLFNNSLYSSSMLGSDEVSLVPVGESHSDFSSLKVFKRKMVPSKDAGCCEANLKDCRGEDDAGSAYSDESGYEEEELASSIANVILV